MIDGNHHIKDIIYYIDDSNGLNEEEAKILSAAVKKIRKMRTDHLEASLKRASEIVDSWPEWKRNALGRIK